MIWRPAKSAFCSEFAPTQGMTRRSISSSAVPVHVVDIRCNLSLKLHIVGLAARAVGAVAQSWLIAKASYSNRHQTLITTEPTKALGRNTMTKKSPMILSVIGVSALAVFSMAVPVDAKKVGDWTCSDFLKASSGEKNRVVFFFEGIRLADKKDTLDLAANDFNVPVSKVVQYCTRNQPANIWDALLNHFYWRARQLP
jgi:hypothetical protein